MASWIMMPDGECMMRWPAHQDGEPRVIWLRSTDPFGRHRETTLERSALKKRARRSRSVNRAKDGPPQGRHRTP
jgi:hypothetical protein